MKCPEEAVAADDLLKRIPKIEVPYKITWCTPNAQEMIDFSSHAGQIPLVVNPDTKRVYFMELQWNVFYEEQANLLVYVEWFADQRYIPPFNLMATCILQSLLWGNVVFVRQGEEQQQQQQQPSYLSPPL